MSVPRSTPSHCFDHSTNEHGRRRNGCSHIPYQHGTFHWPIACVFCLYDRPGTSRRPRDARASLSRAIATLTTKIRERSHPECDRSAVGGSRPKDAARDDFPLSRESFSRKDAAFDISRATLKDCAVSILLMRKT